MVKKVIRFIVLIIGLSLVAYSGYHLFKIYSDYNTSDKTYEKLQDEYAVDDSKKNDDSSEAQSPWYDDIDIDFAGLRSENPDVVGWIYFENEVIAVIPRIHDRVADILILKINPANHIRVFAP